MGFAVSVRALFRIAVYLAVGALFYSLFVAPHFDWSAPMTYVWLLIWPLMLFLHFVAWIGALILAVIVVVALIAVFS